MWLWKSKQRISAASVASPPSTPSPRNFKCAPFLVDVLSRSGNSCTRKRHQQGTFKAYSRRGVERKSNNNESVRLNLKSTTFDSAWQDLTRVRFCFVNHVEQMDLSLRNYISDLSRLVLSTLRDRAYFLFTLATNKVTSARNRTIL